MADIKNSGTNNAGSDVLPKIAYIKDEKPSGTAGGTFTSGADRIRDLNTLSGDTEFITLACNQFTLSAGKYEIEASVSAFAVQNHKAKLVNKTDSTDDIIGSSERADAAGATAHVTPSKITGTIEITSSKTFEIQHRCSSTQATTGFGTNSSFGVVEVYTQVKITKIA